MSKSSRAILARGHAIRRYAWPAFFVVLGALGALHILIRTARYGAAISGDSAVYISVAENLAAGQGLVDFAGHGFRVWPPLFPALLALLGFLGLEGAEAGRFISVAAFALVLALSGLWLHRHLESRLLAMASAGVLLVSLPLNTFASYVRVEALLILLIVGALMGMGAFLRAPAGLGRRGLILSAVCAALAPVTHYAGITAIGAGGLALFARRDWPFLTRARYAAVYGACAVLPLALVMTRNWLDAQTLLGVRSNIATGQSLASSVRQTITVLRHWLTGEFNVGPFLPAAMGGLVLGAALCAFIARRRDMPPPRGVLPHPALPFGLFVATYLPFIVLAAPLAAGQPIDSRYLAPLYVPGALVAASLMDGFIHMRAAGRLATVKRFLTAGLMLSLGVHCALTALRNARLTATALASGYIGENYNTAFWTDSATVAWMRTHALTGHGMYDAPERSPYRNQARVVREWDGYGRYVYSNRASLTYWITKMPSRQLGPDLASWWAGGVGTGHVVWINSGAYPGFSSQDLQLMPGVETIAEFPDGAIFRVTRGLPWNAAALPVRRTRYLEAQIRQAGPRLLRAVYDVHLNAEAVSFVKTPCRPEDTRAKFILHVTPVDPNDLSSARRAFGFDNLGFRFAQNGLLHDDRCFVRAVLPPYAIARLGVGQFLSSAQRDLWKEDIVLSPPRAAGQR